ncbi:hypothetical protein ABZY58_12130 [Micromonospora tulbaghiae]|uniref:hypothetical protein n=1 Tax=Micromonospora tulbaghiae TaxID=479978 RepID=UPI0033A6D7B9
MIDGDTSVAAFLWYLPAIWHDLRPQLIGLSVTLIVLTFGGFAALVLVVYSHARDPQPEGEVDPGRLLPMSRSRRGRGPLRTGTVCVRADDTSEVPR